jgi:AI-2 transport protein TqsA
MTATTSKTMGGAVVLIAVVIAGAALYWLREILAPLALAAFLLIMIDGLAEAVRRYVPAVPSVASLPAAIILVSLAFLGSVWIVIDGFAGFASQLSGIHARLDAIFVDVANAFHLKVASNLDQLLSRLDPQQYVGALWSGVQGAASEAFFVLIYLGFLLASRQSFGKKAAALFRTQVDRLGAEHIFGRVREGVESYVWVQTVLSVIVTVPAWIAMAAVGLENAPFWAFVIFVSGYIPIIGGVIALVAPPLFALVQFHSYWQAIVLFVVIEVIQFGVGNVLLPRMQGKSMNIDPVVVLLALAFWGALWGLPGAFLSTPLTVVAMAILAEFKGSRWAAVLLSGDGEPYPANPAIPVPEPSPEPAPAGRKRATKSA